MLLSGGGQVGNFLTQGGKVFPPWVGKFSHLSPPLRSFRDLATSWGTSALTVVPQLIKRLLQFLSRASPKAGVEPTIVRLLDRRSRLLSQWDLDEIAWSLGPLYISHCIFLLKHQPRAYCTRLPGMKYSFWKIAGLRPAIFSGTPRNLKAYYLAWISYQALTKGIFEVG